MKAVQLQHYGGSAAALLADVDIPAPVDGEVLAVSYTHLTLPTKA